MVVVHVWIHQQERRTWKKRSDYIHVIIKAEIRRVFKMTPHRTCRRIDQKSIQFNPKLNDHTLNNWANFIFQMFKFSFLMYRVKPLLWSVTTVGAHKFLIFRFSGHFNLFDLKLMSRTDIEIFDCWHFFR